ncbi:winged helix-turn-helix domain-containing protein [Pseudoalteromonas luteoviolacea]|uniref:OmpR/PhoB-type domain-containing protein n=1 Tax=Pseudoalteromonas luteoviolacea S4054 TaxID=1129367 RepID=A0A0F6AGI0_9GAMM|nr:winged helix-turn-helix domain-containing protein [Pseudoalteromonas luteoviolacea]AOT08113.1 hypothetical protein S4054249_09765 [Pseudoalteromonas luteoviolacea]AOT13030.1 hypothetical protein S40542_09765 [Pseudoalteromonas luteoviolacea]AOT17942.1 hypothetical protein S4054_09760 [Pseudoalteromonas luteoviolacea]KKE84499.1 hypothetical protein N479_08735 [Pseudoalteromonas luteoviolacea S4054]KZN69527.1 hypothetical protein N481_22305 [Pseudoalteromonas luteoviolacea S4047-1]
MAKQYWIGEFFVDLSRNQITQNKQPQLVAPKALAVLTCLAEKQGKVVSQNTLLSEVWPDTIVSPNSLQRSIAQLRKALGDDGKGQIYIKTHSKQGYSLECNVRWQPESQTDLHAKPILPECQNKIGHLEKNNDVPTKLLNWRTTLTFLFITLALSSLIGIRYATSDESQLFSVGEIRALTASDGREFASIYSPDGKYIIFHRFSMEECVNNIWAKNLETQQEYKLTEDIDSYGTHSFSPDGKQLVFIRTMDCEQPTTQKKCYQLISMDFKKALREPQPMNVLLECKTSEIRLPHWLKNNDIALLHRESTRSQLISYSPKDKQSKVLYQVDNGNIIYYDYSVKDDLFSVISIHKDSKHYVEILDSNGELISSNPIVFTPDSERKKYLVANFSPIENHLIFSTGRQFFTLSYNGEVKNISIPLDQPTFSPNFHPDGERALVIKGNYDSDIAVIPMNHLRSEQLSVNSHIIDRSAVAEDTAIAEPIGNLIAFSSNRSGNEQIWLKGNQPLVQLTKFPIDSYISGMHWDERGESILANVNNKLVQVHINGEQQHYTTPHLILELLHWHRASDKVLTFANIRGVQKLTEYDLKTSQFKVVTDKRINWADKTNNGLLVYTDNMDRFWLVDGIDAEPITALDNQGGDNKRFIIKDSTIYGMNNELELWSYNLINQHFNTLGSLPSNTINIDDIDKENVLITVRIASKKEVVEIVLKE